MIDRNGLCVVTGASSGIGKEIAICLHASGYRVLGTCRHPENADPVPGVELAALDLASEASLEGFTSMMAAREECVSLLVNNAGYGAIAPLAALGYAELERQFRTNVVGPLALTGALLPFMEHGSVVVDVGSVSGDFATPFAGAYCASKAALHQADESLRLELGALGIHVMSLRPGGIVSAFGENAAHGAWTPPPGSPWERFAPGILARATESQSKAAPARALAERLLKALEKNDPPAVLRFGPRSLQLVLLRALLPRRVIADMLKKKYMREA